MTSSAAAAQIEIDHYFVDGAEQTAAVDGWTTVEYEGQGHLEQPVNGQLDASDDLSGITERDQPEFQKNSVIYDWKIDAGKTVDFTATDAANHVEDEEKGFENEAGEGEGNGEGEGEKKPEIDAEGYRVEHRFETESVSRCKEVRELPDESTEMRLRETKEVTLEELKTKDGETRPATLEEIRALLEAQFDGKDEVEISREVVVEEFNRVESQREEVVAGKVVATTVSVTEERKTEEIHETPQFAKAPLMAPEDTELPVTYESADQQPETSQKQQQQQTESAPAAVVESIPPDVIPQSPPPVVQMTPEKPTGGKSTPEQKSKKGGGKFSLFGKKKTKKSESTTNGSEDTSMTSPSSDAKKQHKLQKRFSFGRKSSPRSPEKSEDGSESGPKEGGGGGGADDSRNSGKSSGFNFFSLKRNKAKQCTKVTNSASLPSFDADDDRPENDDRLVYTVEEEGKVVGKSRTATAAAAAASAKSPRRDDLITGVVSDEPSVDQLVDEGRHLVVVAIDFGTTFSGYAFSFVPDRDALPDDGDGSGSSSAAAVQASIHMMRRWEGGDPGVINQKTLTALLLTPTGQFQAFGFTARNFYHDLDPVEAQRWMYFDKFKMALHNNPELGRSTLVSASNGSQLPAVTVLAHALRHFSQQALREISDQAVTSLTNDDVRWVITVPAIWSAAAKQLMRQAAYDAGIASPQTPEQLIVALEPEAASIYIRKLRMSQLVPQRAIGRRPLPSATETAAGNTTENGTTSELVSESFGPGTRYMVVDCGGGTVDITVHEMDAQTGKLKELYKATGGPYGSAGVDREFEKLLEDIFTAEFISAFKAKRPAGWVDLMIAFESRKRAADPNKDQPLNVSLPFSFIDFHKKFFGTQVESAIKKYGNKDVRWSAQGMLRLMPEAMQALYQPTLDSIKNSIGQIINNKDVKDIELLFLVGGFAESVTLQHSIRQQFGKQVKIVIPQDASLAILKGAVCFGLDPSTVAVRRSRQTYGVGVVRRFVRGRHPESKLVHRDGVDWCLEVFDKFVGAGDPVFVGGSVIRRYAPADRDQTASVIHVYCSEDPEIQFVTDAGVQRCGTLRLDVGDLPPPSPETRDSTSRRTREIQAKMTFGGTEIKVSAVDVTSGHCVRCTIDFLSQ